MKAVKFDPPGQPKQFNIIRRRLSMLNSSSIINLIAGEIQRIERIGHGKELTEENGVNITHLFTLLKWAVVYSEHGRSGMKINNESFRLLYNHVYSISGTEYPASSYAHRFDDIVNRYLPQYFLQRNASVAFLIFSAIAMQGPDLTRYDSEFKENGYDNLMSFLVTHFSVSFMLLLESEYSLKICYFDKFSRKDLLKSYLEKFYPTRDLFANSIRKEHASNVRKHTIWKEYGDFSYLFQTPGFSYGGHVVVISKRALDYFCGYGLINLARQMFPNFYKSFSAQFESFVFSLLANIGGVILNDQEFKKRYPLMQKKPDGLFESPLGAIVLEYKSGKPPRYMFEYDDISSNIESLEKTLRDGIEQVIDGMNEYARSNPAAEVYGLIITFQEFPFGKMSSLISQIFGGEFIDQHRDCISRIGVCSIIDFMPLSKCSANEFFVEVKTRISSPNFFPFRNGSWAPGDFPAIKSAIDVLYEEAVKYVHDDITAKFHWHEKDR